MTQAFSLAEEGCSPIILAHEKWAWDIRLEPEIIDAFAKIWQACDLVTAFDGADLALFGPMQPIYSGRWDHADQHPLKHGLRSIQGILNLNLNVRLLANDFGTPKLSLTRWGPDDEGLCLYPGSHKYFDSYFSEE